MADTDLSPAPGVLLVAPPMLVDPNFRRTVVLVCEHGAEGSFGLVLTRPLTLRLDDVLDGFSAFNEPLLLGGPVQPNTLHFLHRCGAPVPDAISLTDGIFWGGAFDVVRTLFEQQEADAADFRFFLGYAGWSPGQLELEVEEGGWILAPAYRDNVFTDEPGKLWRTVLRRMGGDYAVLANYPDDLRMN